MERSYEEGVRYHITLLSCFFLGIFGVHRIINGKKASGTTYLVLYFILCTLLIVGFIGWAIGSLTMLFSTFARLIGLILMIFALPSTLISMAMIILSVIGIIIIHVLVFIDLISIVRGKFKNELNQKFLKSGKSFLKTWSHIVVIVVTVILVTTMAVLYGGF